MSENEQNFSDVTEPVENQKMIPQDEVNKIVGREKKAAREAARAEERAKIMAELESTQPVQQPYSMGGQERYVTPEQVDDIVNQRLQRTLEHATKLQEEANIKAFNDKWESDYNTKLSAGKKDIPDFDEVMSSFTPTAYQNLRYLASQESNTAEIMHFAAQNPGKAAVFETIASRDAAAARAEFRKLVKTMEDNKIASKASNNTKASEPLSRLKPGVAGTDNGQSSMRDLKKKYRT